MRRAVNLLRGRIAPRSSTSLLLFLAATVALGAGCETEVRMREVRMYDPSRPGEDGEPTRVTREQTLRNRIDADPKDARAWFDLGSYYEESGFLVEGANCYEKGNSLFEPRRYTGGYYLLARIYFRMKEFDRSLVNLEVLHSLEPRDARTASTNEHFREAHYLHGALHMVLNHKREAKRHFMRFLELGGEESRVEELLDEIDGERPEKPGIR